MLDTEGRDYKLDEQNYYFITNCIIFIESA